MSLALALAALLLGVAGAEAQQTRLRVTAGEENFRLTPNGLRVAVVLQGSELLPGRVEGGWREGVLEGWMPAPLLEEVDRDGYRLAVRSQGGTLHSRPAGTPLARALGGMLVEEAERRGEWVRVRRSGWIWGRSVEEVAATGDAAPPPPPEAPVLLASPGGDTLAVLRPDASPRPLGREGSWVRVRLEGWMRGEGSGGVATGATVTRMREQPALFNGRTVDLTLQFLALREAEPMRADLPPGEPYLLVRGLVNDPGFVYVLLQESQLAAARRLTPLQRVRVLARVRTGRSELMGHPVLEALRLTPIPRS